MKKSLLLMALLGSVTAASLHAEEKVVMWDGVTYDSQSMSINGAYTSYKHKSWVSNPDPGDTSDYMMCGPASASNVLAWWLDRVEQSGALIVPANVPRGYKVWEEVRTLYQNKAVNAAWVLQFWLTGYTDMTKTQWMTEKGQAFQGYFPHLSGGRFNFGGDAPRTANCITSAIASDGNLGTYQTASEQLIQGMKDGWGYVVDVRNSTGSHYMTVYGAITNEEGLLTKVYYSDNNNSGGREGYAQTASLSGTPTTYGGEKISASSMSGYTSISNFFGLRTRGLEFDTYEATATADNTADLFSHYMNLTIDGAADFKLKYDLRNADEEGSPVVSNLPDGTHVTTGNLAIKDGKVTFIDSTDEKTKEYDRGGSVAGTITYEAKEGNTSRTLTVDRTAAIAKEIHLNAADGNTLEVTGDNTATFGKLTGEGNLSKTGTGTAEVTEAVSLKGSIDVQQGKFILGVDATLSADTMLTVAKDAHMESKTDAPVTLSITSGIHTNDGAMTLTTTLKGGTLKGSGTFGTVTVDGGKLVVGNSPGHQEYEGALTLNSGSIEFAVSGFETASSGNNTGWGSGTYSTINMGNHEFIVNPEGEILIALNGDAANTLTQGGGFTLQLVSGMANTLTDDQLAALAAKTTFVLYDEEGAGIAGRANLAQPEFTYQIANGVLMLTSGTGADSGNANVPEPATGTLSLLALAGLLARRRRK